MCLFAIFELLGMGHDTNLTKLLHKFDTKTEKPSNSEN